MSRSAAERGGTWLLALLTAGSVAVGGVPVRAEEVTAEVSTPVVAPAPTRDGEVSTEPPALVCEPPPVVEPGALSCSEEWTMLEQLDLLLMLDLLLSYEVFADVEAETP